MKYGYCEADLWTAEERAAATTLLEGLRTSAAEQRERLRGQGRSVDADTWLWPGQEPDFEGELARVVREAEGGSRQQQILGEVADRLLDRKRIRVASSEEREIAVRLLQQVRVDEGERSEEVWRGLLLECAEALGAEDGNRVRQWRAVAEFVARRMAVHGTWDEKVEDGVPVEIQPQEVD